MQLIVKKTERERTVSYWQVCKSVIYQRGSWYPAETAENKYNKSFLYALPFRNASASAGGTFTCSFVCQKRRALTRQKGRQTCRKPTLCPTVSTAPERKEDKDLYESSSSLEASPECLGKQAYKQTLPNHIRIFGQICILHACEHAFNPSTIEEQRLMCSHRCLSEIWSPLCLSKPLNANPEDL